MTRPPMPIVVGVPRSGTTMLRFMLDAHSQLAIPPETGFLLDPALTDGTPAVVAERLVRFPADAPAWPDFGLDATSFLAAAGRLPDGAQAADVLRLFYGLYAGRHAKPRFGDKTPGYLSVMPRVAQALPEARFVHVLRDGRDVALSWRERWFAPSQDVVELVRTWRGLIEGARADAGEVPYLEVRYSDLVLNAATELRRVCAFLELPFEPSMLRFHERAAERLQEHGARLRTDGTTVVSRADRHDQQRRTSSPPDATRIGRWRQELTPEQIADCDRVAGELLRSVTG